LADYHLVEFTINGTLNRLSEEGIALTHWWDNKIMGYTAPAYKMEYLYGGYCKMSFGEIILSPDLFSSDWPPPLACAITDKYTATTEAAASTIFTGVAHLNTINRESIVYDIYDTNQNINLLTEGADYNGDTVPYPKAFGVVAHVNPLRLADAGGKPTYHLGGITGTKHTNWHIYDDGVDICTNATDNGDGTFSLNVALVGELTLSGTGGDTTLSDIMSWACGASYLNLTYNNTYAESPSPDIYFWADSQKVLVDFLSEICSWYCHLFYISGTTLYLVDLDIDNGSDTLTEFDFFPAEYNYQPVVATIKTEWETREAGTWQQVGGGGGAAVYVRRVKNNLTKTSGYAYGSEMTITPYHDTKSNISTALSDILTIIHKPWAKVAIPIQGSLPVPGKSISIRDTALNKSTDITIRARNIVYDYTKNEVVIEGEGSISLAQDKLLLRNRRCAIVRNWRCYTS